MIMLQKIRHSAIPAVYLFLVNEGKVLLSLRKNTGYEDNKFSAVAGHVEEGETPVEAMIREAKEEAGIKLKVNDLEFCHMMYRKSDRTRVDIFFIASVWEGNIKNMEQDKCGKLEWFDIDHLPSNMVEFVKIAFYNSLNKVTFSEYGWRLV
jgi:8-oxo-dGTP pyrophosphatase MutT (NUDIX family)